MKPQTQLIIFVTMSFCLTTLLTNGQYTSSDFTIITKGLSEKYASRFKESSNKEVLVSMFNQLDIIHNIAPIKITISFENNTGNVTAEINYDHDKIFSGNNNCNAHNENLKRYTNGKGISTFLQFLIFESLSSYKKSVAIVPLSNSTVSYSVDKDLLNFQSTIILKKTSGDWASFYASNFLNSRGLYPFGYYSNVQLSIGGKIYETETSNLKMLNDMNYFFVGKTIGLDGNKTGAYYFCKFFKINTE